MAEFAKPEDTSGMTQKDDTVYKDNNAPHTSIAAKSKDAILSEANRSAHSGEDPLARMVRQDVNVPGFYSGSVPISGKITGEADPVFARMGFAIGDRVYHKKQKSEGVVKDMLASGKVIVHLDNGVKGKSDPSNLVKL